MERRYKADMTRKEKRQSELEKLKALSFGGKIEYIWMYYKSWFAVLAIAAALIYIGISMYQGSRENILLNVAIVGGNSQDTEGIQSLEKEMKEWLGASGKYDKVRVQANIPEDGGSVASQTALTTLIGANAVDILICPEDIYNEYAEQGGFEESMLMLENEGAAAERFEVTYEKIYVCVMVNAPNKDNAVKIMTKLNEYSEY